MNLLCISTLLLCIALGISSSSASSSSSHVVVCYFPSWSMWRAEPYRFTASDVPAQYCTHVIWSFITIKDKMPTPATQGDNGQLRALLSMKSQRPDLKVMASLGGANSIGQFSLIVNSQRDIDNFADAALEYVLDNGLDGIDIDWEFPTAQEKNNLTRLLQACHGRFSSRNLLVSIALGAAQTIIENSYDLPQIAQFVDLMNVMTYDLHGHWDSQTGFQAALYPQNQNHPYFSQEWVIRRYLELGMPAEKAVLGIPLYGRVFKLCDVQQTGLGAQSCGAGDQGPVSATPGILFYYEICEKLQRSGGVGLWSTVYNEIGHVPYSYRDNQWITYENTRSITEKVAYINEKGLAGAMVWDVSQDDFKDFCHMSAFPLVGDLARLLDSLPPAQASSTTDPPLPTTTATTTTTTTTTTTARSNDTPKKTTDGAVTPQEPTLSSRGESTRPSAKEDEEDQDEGGTSQARVTLSLILALGLIWGTLWLL